MSAETSKPEVATVNDKIREPTALAIDDAAAALRAGELVSFPTETVYGLGADATNGEAVAAIFAAKRRPRFNPLIIHVATLRQARELVEFDDRAVRLGEALWPGPLTLVLPRTAPCPISLLASAGLETLAVRIPDNKVAMTLLEAAAKPIAAPSANTSGTVSPTRAIHVAEDLGPEVALILDGGPCRIGIESTIIAIGPEGVTILRQGAVEETRIEEILGQRLVQAPRDDRRIRAPGQLFRHYAPETALRLNARTVGPGEALLAFGKALDGASRTLNLSPSQDLTEAAANLFAMIKELDDYGFPAIAVMAIPEVGLGIAINDRLRRGAGELNGY